MALGNVDPLLARLEDVVHEFSHVTDLVSAFEPVVLRKFSATDELGDGVGLQEWQSMTSPQVYTHFTPVCRSTEHHW